ncbi:hypothetical protein [Phaeobacter inhibens]|nr:hypothetical protein [Phaeobacter inhibens]
MLRLMGGGQGSQALASSVWGASGTCRQLIKAKAGCRTAMVL